MPIEALGSLSLLILILLIVPGYFGLDQFHGITGRRPRFSRFEWVIYSTFLSICTICILYLLLSLGQIFLGHPTTITIEQLEESNLIHLVGFYILLIASSMLIGAGVGKYFNKYRYGDPDLDLRPPWEYAFGKNPSEEIEVQLTDGSIIRGQFVEESWDPDENEIYLEDPEQVAYNEGIEVDSVEIGRSVLITGDIEYVSFIEEDPHTEQEAGEVTQEAVYEITNLKTRIEEPDERNDSGDSSG